MGKEDKSNGGAGKYTETSKRGIGNHKFVSGGTTLRLGKTKPRLPKNGNHP